MRGASKSSIDDIQDDKTKSLIGSFFSSPGKKKNIEIPNIKLVDNSSYKKQQICQVCFIPFTQLKRQHHCRICANAVCGGCSVSEVNKQRCCDTCIYFLQNKNKQTIKKNLLIELEGAAQIITKTKNAMEQEAKRIGKVVDEGNAQKNIKEAEKRIKELEKQINQLKFTKQFYLQKIQKIQV